MDKFKPVREKKTLLNRLIVIILKPINKLLLKINKILKESNK